MTRLLALAVLLSSAASAQSYAPAEASHYAGLYAADGGMVEVRPATSDLVLVAHGAPVAARLAHLTASDEPTDARAEALLDAWVTGDLEAVVASVRPARQDEARASFDRYRSALVRGHGDAVAAGVVGTFESTAGGRVTLVQLLFDRGSEWASLVWGPDGALVTMTRGLSPVVVGTVRSVSPDAFAGAGAEVRFERGDRGRVEAVHVDGRFSAVR